MDAPRPEGMAAREGVHLGGRLPAQVREDGPVHGGEARRGCPETHPGADGRGAESPGRRDQYRRADDQGAQENRGGAWRAHHADWMGGNRARTRERSEFRPAARSAPVIDAEPPPVPFQLASQPLTAFSPFCLGNREWFLPAML